MICIFLFIIFISFFNVFVNSRLFITKENSERNAPSHAKNEQQLRHSHGPIGPALKCDKRNERQLVLDAIRTVANLEAGDVADAMPPQCLGIRELLQPTRGALLAKEGGDDVARRAEEEQSCGTASGARRRATNQRGVDGGAKARSPRHGIRRSAGRGQLSKLAHVLLQGLKAQKEAHACVPAKKRRRTRFPFEFRKGENLYFALWRRDFQV